VIGLAGEWMATVLGIRPNTVSREFARNVMSDPFHASLAQTLVEARVRQRPRTLLDPCRWRYARTRLTRGFSPKQIAGRLRHEYPSDMRKHLSAETVYVVLNGLPRGTLSQGGTAPASRSREFAIAAALANNAG
jgi:IS30 family transposase